MIATGFLLFTLLLAAPAPAGIAPPRSEADQIELLRLERVWNRAHVEGNAAALERLWDRDLIVNVPGMPAMDRATVVGLWHSGGIRFRRYQTSDLRIRVYGEAAVVTGKVSRERTIGNREVIDHWRFTKVYIRRPAGWKVVAWHASKLGTGTN